MEAEKLTLPQEKTERNIVYISRRRQSNRLIYQTMRREASFECEVRDLFYFFDGFGQYLKNLTRMPEFREGHDERLVELGEALSGLDLATDDDIKYQEYLRRVLAEKRLKTPRGISRAHGLLEIINGLRGEVNTKQLKEDELKKYLGKRRIRDALDITVPLAIGAGAVGYGATKIDNLRDGLIIGFCGLLFGASAVAVANLNRYRYIPFAYDALRAKAKITDLFIQQNMK